MFEHGAAIEKAQRKIIFINFFDMKASLVDHPNSLLKRLSLFMNMEMHFGYFVVLCQFMQRRLEDAIEFIHSCWQIDRNDQLGQGLTQPVTFYQNGFGIRHVINAIVELSR